MSQLFVETLLLAQMTVTMTAWANQSAAANGLSAVRSSVAGVREHTVRSTATSLADHE
jgi:hypothetical protein